MGVTTPDDETGLRFPTTFPIGERCRTAKIRLTYEIRRDQEYSKDRPRSESPSRTSLKELRKLMLFEYTRHRGGCSPVTDAATFKVARLKKTHLGELEGQSDRSVDLTSLIDRSYNYHSPRELRWHLAERFGVAPSAVALRESITG